MLEFKNISLIKKDKKNTDIILDDISFNLPKTGLVTFKGKFNSRQPLLRLIAGFDKPTSGEILFNDKIIQYNNPIQLSKYRFNNIGISQRKDNFFEMLTVKENYDLLNLYTRLISNEKIKEVLEYIGLDEKVLGLKPQALTKGEQQKLAISKPLLLDVPIIIVENPIKYLDTKDEASDVMELLKKISKERLVLVFTNDDCIDDISNGIITIEGNKIKSNTISSSILDNDITSNISSGNKISSSKFITKLSANLALSNINYNIWIFLFIIFGLIFLSLGMQYKVKKINNKDLRDNLIKTNNKYAWLSTLKNIMEEPLKEDDLKLSSDIFYKRYYIQRDITSEKKANLLSNAVSSIVEVKDFSKTGFKLLAGRFPKDNEEVLITKKTAIKMYKELENGGELEDSLIFEKVIDREFEFKINGNKKTPFDQRRVSGIIDDSDNTISECLYTLDGFYKDILKKGIHNLSGIADITNFEYKGNDEKVKKRIEDYNGIKNKKVFYKDIDGFMEKMQDKIFNITTIEKYDGKKLNEIELEDDEVILPADLYNAIFNDVADRLVLEKAYIKEENLEDPLAPPNIKTIIQINKDKLLKNVSIDITTRTGRISPNHTPNGYIKKRYKVVGVFYGETSTSLNITGKSFSQIDEMMNTSIIFSKNQMKKLSEYVNHPFEYMANLNLMQDLTLNKNMEYSKFRITNEIIANSEKILNNQSAKKVSITYLVFGTLFFVGAVMISVSLTKSRYKKRNNLFATFWMGGRNEFEIKAGFLFNNLIMSLAGFLISLIICPLFIYFFQLSVIGSLKNIFGNVYTFNGYDILFLLLFAILFSVFNTAINILFMNRKNLKVGKYLN